MSDRLLGKVIYFCDSCQYFFKSETPPVVCAECHKAGSISGPMNGEEYLKMWKDLPNGNYEANNP